MYVLSIVWFVFFFQAEDGIRDLVRSRGLGDVYKRQVVFWQVVEVCVQREARHGAGIFQGTRKAAGHVVLRQGKFIRGHGRCADLGDLVHDLYRRAVGHVAVSYTHLTLPTSDLV